MDGWIGCKMLGVSGWMDRVQEVRGEWMDG